MTKKVELTIPGHRGEAVPNELVRQEGDTDHLAVLMPGFGYTCDMPVFYYAGIVCLDAGADVLRLQYAYNRQPEFRRLRENERLRWLTDDVTAGIHVGLGQRIYRRATLIGKSLGTLALSHVLPVVALSGDLRVIWLTPMLQAGAVRKEIQRRAETSLVVIGTDDPVYDEGFLSEFREAGGEVVTIQRGDHSLDIDGDPLASIRALEPAVAAMQRVVSRAQ